MKFLHLADLHIGKRVNGFSMLEDQQYILDEIVKIAKEEQPDGVLIAGDVYDKSVPSAEAVELLDFFLNKLTEVCRKVFVISGNHDSPERIAFGGSIMEAGGVYMSPVYSGDVKPITLEDEHGEINIYMLPFIKPINVRRFFPEAEVAEAEAEVGSYTDALATAVKAMNINTDVRNILITHQFVTGAKTSGSEEISVGGSDNVDCSVFHDFDYVALGHIHGAQRISSETIRYCGSPLKYSFSEAKHKKSVTIVEMGEKGNIQIKLRDLKPLHDMHEIRGTYMDLAARDFYIDTTYSQDYMHITLTDEEDVPYAFENLRTIYHNLMTLDYDNMRTRRIADFTGNEEVERKTPIELFSDFYENQNGQAMSKNQLDFTEKIIEEIWEGR